MSTKPNILVIEDDADIQQLVSYNLIKAGLNATCADSGEEALAKLDEEQFDGIILDLMLPGKDGLEMCRCIRQRESTATIPIIMLTAKSEEDDIVAGLESGADDYVTKPFSPKVLIARVQVALRHHAEQSSRSQEPGSEAITLHGLQIHPGRYEALVHDKPIQLTSTEFAILLLLVERAGWVFTRQQIIDRIRGYDFLITPRAVDVQIFGLRKKLGEVGHIIETVRGIGYRIKE
ncbi:MAG: response regulator transcription factor [Deltaproteobacteria bacterium]|nr:response regulator transcription factor [Deltaproteobacteria bacterium]